MNPKIRDLEQRFAEVREQLSKARRDAAAEPVGAYSFDAHDGTKLALAELFGSRHDLLVVHNMGRSCRYCTLWADGLNGVVPHLESRAAFVVTSPDDVETQRAFAASRGWLFRMVSCRGTLFAADMGFEPEPGKFWPGVSGFHRDQDGTITRTGRAEFGPGDEFCATWHLFDLLPGGPAGWEPKLRY